jgi:hypothetical protein
VVSALCGALALVAQPTAMAAPTAPNLDWQPCDSAFFCATATVPLDYANPVGATIQIAVIKHLATDPAHRIGSVFFNPGGPGGSGPADSEPDGGVARPGHLPAGPVAADQWR